MAYPRVLDGRYIESVSIPEVGNRWTRQPIHLRNFTKLPPFPLLFNVRMRPCDSPCLDHQGYDRANSKRSSQEMAPRPNRTATIPVSGINAGVSNLML